jgi:membrane-bound metal-dependent hydrolase YbcI (DUF457 family)
MRVDTDIGWTEAVVGALVGTVSHVLLDSVMHHDMRPFWPISTANPFLRVVDVGELHLACIGAGVVGAALLALRQWLATRQAAE